MKVHFCIKVAVLLLLGGQAFAQTPSIDSLLIDESKSVLTIFGKFGAMQGTATCGGLQLPIINWSDSLIAATIPDTGIGSVGPVVIDVNSQQSNEQLISSWETITTNESSASSGGLQRSDHFDMLRIKFRLDLQSLLQSKNTAVRKFDAMKGGDFQTHGSRYTQYESGKGSGYSNSHNDTLPLYHNVAYTKGMQCRILYLPNQPAFNIEVWGLKGIVIKETYRDAFTNLHVDTTFVVSGNDFNVVLYLDPSYQIINDTSESSNGGVFYERDIKVGVASFLPQSVIAHKHKPIIGAPQNGSTGLPTSEVLLRWNRIPYTSNYQVQVSLDSLVNSIPHRQTPQSQIFLDTVVATTELLLPPLERTTKYFWRVRGVYDSTEGGWSAVPNFTTGINADVNDKNVFIPQLIVYPNPVQEKTILRFALIDDGDVSCSLYDVLGRDLWNIPKHQFSAGEHQLVCDLKGIPAGQYLFKLTVDGKQSTVVLIKR